MFKSIWQSWPKRRSNKFEASKALRNNHFAFDVPLQLQDTFGTTPELQNTRAMHTAWRQHSKIVCGLIKGTEEKRTGQKWRNNCWWVSLQRTPGLRRLSYHCSISRQQLHHFLEGTMGPLATLVTASTQPQPEQGKRAKQSPGNKSPRQKVPREKEHRAIKNNTRAGVWCSKDWCDKADLKQSCPTLTLYYKNPWWKCLETLSLCPQAYSGFGSLL